MKLKKEYLVLLVVIAALSVYLTLRSKDQTHYTLPQPAQADSQKINRLVITKDGRSIELTKKDEHWYVGPKGYPADSIKVRNMVKAAADLTITDLISESGNYERYDLTDSRKINVKAYADGEMVRNFDLGKGAPTNQHTFARLGDAAKVYHARGHLNTTFDHTIDGLRDLTVLSFEKGDISTLVIQRGTQSMTLTKHETTPEEKTPDADQEKPEDQKAAGPKTQWQNAEGKAVDQPAVERLLSDFSNMKCSQFMDDKAAENLKGKAAIWALTFKSDKETYSLSAFDKADTQALEFPALSSAGPYAFTIDKNKVETVEKQMGKLLGQETKSE